MGTLKHTPLFDWHVAHGARMIDFGGWEMPVYYEGIVAEHQATRERVGLFDLTHMGEFEVKGPDALEFLQSVTTNDASTLSDGQAQYTILCYEDGGIVDDLLLTKLVDRYLLVVNESNLQKDFDWLKAHLRGRVELVDRSTEFSLIGVQGPKTEDLLVEVLGESIRPMPYYTGIEMSHNGVPLIVSRTGYTGEDGFEIILPNDAATGMWELLIQKGQKYGVVPVGLGARDTLRLEMKYALYGNDISSQTNPLEAGLGWVVRLNKDFVGAEALRKVKEAGLKRKLIAFEMVDRGVARQHYPVVLDGQHVGEVTSGSFSPSTGKNIGLAYVPADKGQIGTEIGVEIRGKVLRAAVVKPPFAPSHVKK